MMGFGMVGGMLVFWVIIIVMAVLLVKGLFNAKSVDPADKAQSAKHILDERYAKGEITQAEYLTMLKDIH